MKGFLAGAAALLLSSSVLASQVKISEISYNYPDSKEKQYLLPWVTIKDNPQAARRINDYIFSRFASHLPGKDPQATLNRLAKAGMEPIASLSWSRVEATPRILTLDIFAEGCGAYCESWDTFLSFDLRSGTLINLDDVVTPDTRTRLNDLVRADVRQQITTFVAQQKALSTEEQRLEDDEYVDYQEFYASCLARTETGTHYANDFSLAKNNFVFHNERCSNHASRALDELDTFTSKVPVADMRSNLTPYGLSLLTTDSTSTVAPPPSLNGRLLYGTLGEKTPVVLNITCRETSLDGAYFYRRFGAAIELHGTCPTSSDQPYVMKTYSEDGVTETITLTQAEGKYIGEWHSGDKVLPIEFALF